ncbi:MAG: hypothetical protein AAGA56_22725, partial [Myxococcota bacterium]
MSTWNGQGEVPFGSQSFVGCEGRPSHQYYLCAFPKFIAREMMAAGFYALVKDDPTVREMVADVILRQTDTSLFPGVDFSNQNRWNPHGREVHHQSPFFFTSQWFLKVLKA